VEKGTLQSAQINHVYPL